MALPSHSLISDCDAMCSRESSSSCHSLSFNCVVTWFRVIVGVS